MPHSWSQLRIGQKIFFSLFIHTWIIKIHKNIVFPSRHKQQQQQLHCCTAAFTWVDNWKDFFFSLYTHVTCVSFNVSFSIFFTFSTFLSPPTSGHWTFALIVSLYDSTYCSRYLSLYVLLSFSLFIRTPLTFSL